MPENRPPLRTAEVAQLLQLHVRTVHRMVQTGRLYATRVPGYKGPLLFSHAEVERVRAELAGESESPPAQAQAS